jgi:hypothetical protein
MIRVIGSARTDMINHTMSNIPGTGKHEQEIIPSRIQFAVTDISNREFRQCLTRLKLEVLKSENAFIGIGSI